MRAITMTLCLMGAAMLDVFGWAVAGEFPTPRRQEQAVSAAAGEAATAPRLKFRGGLSCTCATGMSEADIQKAEQAQFREPRQQKRDVGGNHKN